MEHTPGLRKPPTGISEADGTEYSTSITVNGQTHVDRRVPYCVLWCYKTPGSPTLPLRREHSLVGVAELRWGLGQKSVRNDVLLRSLKIAVQPRGDWQIIPDWERESISWHLERKGLSKEVVFLTTSTPMIARDERIRSKLERCGLGWIPLGHPCPVWDSLTAVTPLLALLPRVGSSWMETASCTSSPERWEEQGITGPGRGS